VADSVSRAFKNQFNLVSISPLQKLYEGPESPLFKRATFKKKANLLPKIDQTKRTQGSSSPEHSSYNFIQLMEEPVGMRVRRIVPHR
jgi:hypothetical protein